MRVALGLTYQRMKIDQESPVLLAEAVRLWLDSKLHQAELMREKFLHLDKTDGDDYTHGQLLYANHLCSGIKWIRSNIPKSWASVLVMNDAAVRMVMEQITEPPEVST